MHIKLTHENNKKNDNKCEYCYKLFTHSVNLRIHIKSVHEGQRNHKCDSCEKDYIHSSDLKKHIFGKHNPNKILYKCDICEKSLSSVKSLKLHMSKHIVPQKDPKKSSDVSSENLESESTTSFNENEIIQKDSTPIKSERQSLDIDQIFVCPICKSEGIFRSLQKAQQHISEFHQIPFGVVPQIRTLF